MTDDCLTHKQLCNCDKNHLILKCLHLKLAIKTERTSDEYHLLLIPRGKLRKCKIPCAIKNAAIKALVFGVIATKKKNAWLDSEMFQSLLLPHLSIQ